MKRLLTLPVTGPAVATLVVALLVTLTTDRFLTSGNLNNLALQVSIVALIAIGSTAVIIVGGIDLSPGSMIALLTMLLATTLKFWGIGFWPAIVLTLVTGAAIGAVNGGITAYLRIPAFITTLAGLSGRGRPGDWTLHEAESRQRLLATGGGPDVVPAEYASIASVFNLQNAEPLKAIGQQDADCLGPGEPILVFGDEAVEGGQEIGLYMKPNRGSASRRPAASSWLGLRF